MGVILHPDGSVSMYERQKLQSAMMALVNKFATILGREDGSDDGESGNEWMVSNADEVKRIRALMKRARSLCVKEPGGPSLRTIVADKQRKLRAGKRRP